MAIEATLEYFNHRYPWAEEVISANKPVECIVTFESELNIDVLWPYIADTNLLGKFGGLPKREYAEVDGRLYGKDPRGKWFEEWIWVDRVGVIQNHDFVTGVMRYFRTILLADSPDEVDGSKFYMYLGIVPRNIFGKIFALLMAKGVQKDFGSIFLKMEQFARADSGKTDLSKTVKLKSNEYQNLQSYIAGLQSEGVNPDLLRSIENYILTENDDFISRIRIRPIAERWNFPEEEVVNAFLRAVKIGLLDMKWDTICPHCRNMRQEFSKLSEVPTLGRCEPCMIDFDTTKSDGLEVTFRINSAIRDPDRRLYCSAEPIHRPHIKLHQKVDTQSNETLQTRLKQGRYRLRSKGEMSFNLLDVSDNFEAESLIWKVDAVGQRYQTAVAPLLELENNTDSPGVFIVEFRDEDRQAFRPKDLLNYSDFRRFFPEEAVAEGVALDIGTQIILFTDVVGSTEFYTTVGDVVAFLEVRKHFVKLYEAVENNSGTVVKTIGDAVMASFQSAKDAFSAAESIQSYFTPDNQETRLRLRVTIHKGPCMAINADTGIDYFGSTVNLAAKLQRISLAGQVVLSEFTCQEHELTEYLKYSDYSEETMPFSLKDDVDPILVRRFTIS